MTLSTGSQMDRIALCPTSAALPQVNFLDPRLPERFWAKCIPEPNSGCWLWFAARTSVGYGMTSVAPFQINTAHRYAYETLVGPIPNGLHIDHLCRTRCCVNPAHMEPVTQTENILRGTGFAAINARKTHCPAGHPYNEANTHVSHRKDGGRQCRVCARERARARRAP